MMPFTGDDDVIDQLGGGSSNTIADWEREFGRWSRRATTNIGSPGLLITKMCQQVPGFGSRGGVWVFLQQLVELVPRPIGTVSADVGIGDG